MNTTCFSIFYTHALWLANNNKHTSRFKTLIFLLKYVLNSRAFTGKQFIYAGTEYMKFCYSKSNIIVDTLLKK